MKARREKTGRETLFFRLEPPPGGVDRMAARLALPSRRMPTGARRWAAAAAAVVLAIAVLVPLRGRLHRAAPPAGGLYDAPEFDRLLGRDAEPYELSVSLNQRPVRVVEVPSSDPRIRIYAMQN